MIDCRCAVWCSDTQHRCLVLWRTVKDWSEIVFSVCKEQHISDVVVLTAEEISQLLQTHASPAVCSTPLLDAVMMTLEKNGRAQQFHSQDSQASGYKIYLK
mmetsp:Transcript_18315/g.62214  ORF Transcript_18315/g.62214 Transcript_18315/m.62214 type:complete len:101 (+) Transcript_18315:595-897(+)